MVWYYVVVLKGKLLYWKYMGVAFWLRIGPVALTISESLFSIAHQLQDFGRGGKNYEVCETGQNRPVEYGAVRWICESFG